MRALTRMRLLAAVCALLMTFASISRAGVPGRPIDRPDGPPDPVQVGDPDEPNGFRIIIMGHAPYFLVVWVPRGGRANAGAFAAQRPVIGTNSRTPQLGGRRHVR